MATGFFGDTLKQVYHLDIHNPEVFEAGASAIQRSVIMPSLVYQSLLSLDRELLMGAQTFVVGPDGLLLAHA